MKILELHIENIRGIKSLDINPNGQNFVIWGPNGSGKSAVVDAIDFLLTGRISRLTGPGTRGITLARHGSHIDASAKEAFVQATIKTPTHPEPIEISRRMNQAGQLICAEDIVLNLGPIIELANRKQHVLTRRDILRFITAESSSRAQSFRTLLDLTDVEEIRRAFVAFKGQADNALTAATRTVQLSQSSLATSMQIEEFSEEKAIEFVNQNRKILEAKEILSLHSNNLKEGISAPSIVQSKNTINITVVERDFENLERLFEEEKLNALKESDTKLRSLLKSIRSDPKVVGAIQKRKLLEMGLDMLPETGECPLCETPWPPGELESHLESHLEKADASKEQQEEIIEYAQSLVQPLDSVASIVENIIFVFTSAEVEDIAKKLNIWQLNLKELVDLLGNPLAVYPSDRFSKADISQLLISDDLRSQLPEYLEQLKNKYPESTPEQTAWDTLTRMEENLKSLENAIKYEIDSTSLQTLAETLNEVFLTARDSVIDGLYKEISARFVELYRHLHGPDEANFNAEIESDAAGLALGVDFYGRGLHPPHAMHSEGHQDSMGICIYLALAEKFVKDHIKLTILDDVVMSVDTSHRRQVCSLLNTNFPDKQFLITTHDKTWANQLRSEGIVGRGELIEFYKWDIDTGPYVNIVTDLWDKIDAYLEDNDVNNAAGLMRRGSEQFLAQVCESIGAAVRFRLDGRNDLGDYLSASIGKFNSLLKIAKSSAQSWSDDESFSSLRELGTTASQIYQRTGAEQWVVNAAIHFTNWASLSKQDFQPIREAFQDLHGLFICQECGSILSLTMHEMKPFAVRCNCGYVDWNLVRKTERA